MTNNSFVRMGRFMFNIKTQRENAIKRCIIIIMMRKATNYRSLVLTCRGRLSD